MAGRNAPYTGKGKRIGTPGNYRYVYTKPGVGRVSRGRKPLARPARRPGVAKVASRARAVPRRQQTRAQQLQTRRALRAGRKPPVFTRRPAQQARTRATTTASRARTAPRGTGAALARARQQMQATRAANLSKKAAFQRQLQTSRTALRAARQQAATATRTNASSQRQIGRLRAQVAAGGQAVRTQQGANAIATAKAARSIQGVKAAPARGRSGIAGVLAGVALSAGGWAYAHRQRA